MYAYGQEREAGKPYLVRITSTSARTTPARWRYGQVYLVRNANGQVFLNLGQGEFSRHGHERHLVRIIWSGLLGQDYFVGYLTLTPEPRAGGVQELIDWSLKSFIFQFFTELCFFQNETKNFEGL